MVKRYDVDGCAPWFEADDGGFVDYEDYAVLESKCAALAAENAGLKESRKNLAEFIHEELDADYPLNMDIKTPDTDAFLAEVRAQGGAKALDDFAEFNIKSIDPFDEEYTAVLKETARAARGFAAQLRQDANTAELVAAGIITKVGE